MEVSPSGRYLATAHYQDDAKIALWDMEAEQLRWKADDPVTVSILGFLAGEKLLVTAGQSIQVLSVESGECVHRIPFRTYDAVASLHPSGATLVGLEGNTDLVILNFKSGQQVKTFCLDDTDGLNAFQQMYRAMVTQAAASARKNMVQSMEAQVQVAGVPDNFEEWKKTALKNMSVSAEGVRRVQFSKDGRFLFCATDRAVWVFDWQALASDEESPKPLYRCCPVPDSSEAGIFGNVDTKRMVLGLAHDEIRNHLLFGVGDGTVREMDLARGDVRVLLKIPDALPVLQLGLSSDGSALYTILCPFFKDLSQTDRPPNRFQIWDYAKLWG